MPTPRREGAEPLMRHRSLPESVHAILRYRILNNLIPAGAPLLEVPLANEFGVSRTTIRTAMRELHAERLIDIEPRRGSTVSRMSETDALEVCFARYALESVAVRGLGHGERLDLADRMDAVVGDMSTHAAAGDLAAMVAADTDFHRLIVEASGHPLVVDIWSRLSGQMGALMRSVLDRRPLTLHDTVARHASLVETFRTSDTGGADEALREHYVRHEPPNGETD